MSGEHSVAVQTMSHLELPPPLVTIEDGDLLNPVTGHLIVKPLEETSLVTQDKIGVVPSAVASSTPTGASIPVLELKAKWEIPPPPDCAPPPPPFSNSSSGPSSWDPPVAPHDCSQEASEGTMTVHSIELPLPPPPSILRCPDVPSTESCSQTEAFTSPGQAIAVSTLHGPPSEADSDDADLLRKMVHSRSLQVGGDEGLGDEDDVLIDDYEDEDDASFTVHFAHHGRKEPDMVPAKVDLLAQITELQEAVASMKGSLTEAVARLGAVAAEEPPLALPPPDPAPMYAALQEKCDANTAQVLKLVLALKNDVTGLKKDVSAITERQDLLQRTVEGLLEDRRTDTLGRSGSGSGEGTGGGGPRSSGGHSNDSGVALLLERAHQAFHGDRMSSSPATSTLHRGDDQDSLPDRPSLLVPPLVYDYVAGLSSGQPMHSSLGTGDQDDLAYDSDSSLTLAANKSISLSASISKEMRANMAAGGHPYGGGHEGGHGTSGHHYGGHDVGHGKAVRGHIVTKSKGHSKCSTSNHSSTDSGSGPAINRTDSDGSDQSRDVVQTTRRRRYEKGSSSSTGKLYGPLCRSLSQDSATYQALSTYSAGQGLYSHTSHHHPHRDSRDIHRCRVARELLETEKEYCRTLWIIQDTFANPLQKSRILSKKDSNTLFPTEVYQLYDKHCHLQHQLRERLASWEWQPLVGDILAKFTDSQHSDVLRLYTAYVNDFPEVLKTFHKLCRSSPPFTKFIKSCLEQPSCGGLDLGAFLLTPVQRIPRYILLLKQLLKYTDETHPDFHHVNVCLDRLKNFLERLNDSIEHSFQLVHATFSPGGLLGQPLPVATRQTHGRVSRSPRRTRSTVETSPTYSPERPTSRSADRCSPGHGGESSACSGTSRGVASPKRSISLAGGPAKTLAVSKRRQQSSDGGRSRSLPRAVPLSPVHSQDSSPESGGRPARPLPSARSVADMTQAAGHDNEDEETRENHAGGAASSLWEELAASEPSLLEAQCKQQNEGACHEGGTNGKLSSAQSASNLAQDSGRLRPWRDPATQLDGNPAQDDGIAKKKSIKTSLKNMFTFKKRNAASPSSGNRSTQPTPPHHHHFHHPHDHHHHHHHSHPAHHHPTRPSTARGMREESDYWDPQAAQIQDSSALTSGGQVLETSHPPAQSQAHSQSQQSQTHSQQQQSSSQNNSQQTMTSQVAHHNQNSGSHSQNGLYQSLASLQHPQTPLHIPHPPSTPVPGQSQPGLSVVGDFVDEDGNPCSNV